MWNRGIIRKLGSFVSMNTLDFERNSKIIGYLAFLFSAFLVVGQANAWTSNLYPDDWRLGFEHRDSQGRFLHDFSYAGYHRGEIPIPENPSSNIINVTRAPYNADRSGQQDATSAIQAAIDAAGNAGGGIVFLPSGTYRIASPPLRMSRDNVVIRGAGQAQTRLFFDELNTRLTPQMIMGRTDNGWTNEKPGTVLPIAADIAPESLKFKVSEWPSSFPYNVGDDIIIAHDITTAFVDDHRMRTHWGRLTSRQGLSPRYHRTITALNPSTNEITVDVPIRYRMKTRDNLRVFMQTIAAVREVGIESLSIGQRQHPATGLITGNTPLDRPNGTPRERVAYAVHGSDLLQIRGVINGWIRNVSTYRPPGNSANIHIHSRGIRLLSTRNLTIENTVIERPQSRTGGGNGYTFFFSGAQETLVINSSAVAGRHNFQISGFQSSGNVFHSFTSY